MKKILAIAVGLAAAVTVSVTAAPAHAGSPVYGEGSQIAVVNGSSTIVCTVGPVGIGSDGYTRGFTADHCANAADEGAVVSEYSNDSVGEPIGRIERRGSRSGDYRDVALVKFDRGTKTSTEVLGPGNKNYPLAGSLTPREAYALFPTLCGTGGISGFGCGELTPGGITLGEQSLPMNIFRQEGDSGSGLFAFSEGKAYALGVLVSGEGRVHTYEPVADLAEAWGVKLRSAALN